jgi:hypothetical protein
MADKVRYDMDKLGQANDVHHLVVTREHVTPDYARDDVYVVEASDLEMHPEFVPNVIRTTLGNGNKLCLVDIWDTRMVYKQTDGPVYLTVFND